MSLRTFALGVSACLLAVSVAAAQAPSPLELARGLRENGQPDLALEYLATLETKNPTADVKVVLPLERAAARLALAQLESDEAAREGGVSIAKAEFEKFLADNPRHPRAGEANLSLARVLAVQAKGQLNRAFKVRGPDRKTAAAGVRPLFLQASDLFGKAAAQIDKQIKDDGTDATRKKALGREVLQAELDRGINQYNIIETYLTPEGPEVTDRAAALDAAKAIFTALGKKDESSPACWAARVWAGACDLEKSDKALADAAFKKVRADAAKALTPASGEGIRMVEFFEVQSKYLEAKNDETRPQFLAARAAARNWLDRDRTKTKMTPQRLSVTYYYAYLTLQLGINDVVFKKQTKDEIEARKDREIQSVPGSARALVFEASREFKRLLEFDNEYTERAGEQRNRAIRILVGTTIKDAKDYATFEECQMAAMMQLDLAGKLEDDAKAAGMAKAVALLQRCGQLVTPAVPLKEQNEAKMMLVFALVQVDKPAEAAALGETLAHTPRGGAAAAQGGRFAVDAYLKSAEKLDESDAEGKGAFRNKAVELGAYLDKTYPTDPSTDSVRFRIGKLYLEEKKYQEAFDLLGKVTPTYAGVAAARSLQGRAAFFLINSANSKLEAADKEKVYRKAVIDCEAVPEPSAAGDLKGYFGIRNLLANLHLSNPPTGAVTAETVAKNTIARAAASKMEPGDKSVIAFTADEVRLRAVYSQAVGFYRDGKFKEMADKLGPAIEAMDKSGPALDAKLEGEARDAAASLDRFRRDFVVLAMQGRIREGAIEPAAQLFELLDKLGGTVEATTDALTRLVSLVRPQLEELRKQNKVEEAKQLSQSVAGMLVKQSEKPKLSVQVTAFLGRSLRDLGVHDKAVEVLLKVPSPSADVLKLRTGEIDDEETRNAVIAYQVSQIELARAYRLSQQFDKADAVLLAALGTDKAKGWAKSLEFRKEAVYLMEEKAAIAPADKKLKLWSDAKTGWDKIANEVASTVRNPKLQPNERDRLLPLYLEMLCDQRRCLARGNTQILAATPAKLTDALGKLAGQVIEVETANEKSLNAEVKAKYAALLNDYPEMKAEYVKRGGKAFVEPRP